MDWQVGANVATTIGTAVALIGVVVSLVLSLRSEKLTRKGQKHERDQAKASAKRAEAAARLTEEYTRRVVEALEIMAAAQHGAGGVRRPAVSWSMVPQAGGKYRLENTGTLSAERVNLSSHKSVFLNASKDAHVGPGEAISFIAERTLGTTDSTISVTWLEEGSEEVKSWRYPLPPEM